MDSRPILTRVLIVCVAVFAAGIFGFVLGECSVDQSLPAIPEDSPVEITGQGRRADDAPPPYEPDPDAPPLFVHAGVTTSDGWDVYLREAGMAADAGLHRFIVPLSLPWSGGTLESAQHILHRFVEVDPQASFVLALDLNPDERWLLAHPSEQARPEGIPTSYPSPASRVWQEEAMGHTVTLLSELRASPLWERVQGVVLRALENGRWMIHGGYDRSTASASGFASWLQGYYPDDATLRDVWGDDTVTLTTVAVPGPVESPSWYVRFPDERRLVDFHRYVSDSVADAIAGFTSGIKSEFGNSLMVLAPYGFTLETDHPACGHFALGLLLGSDVDGFISPVSFASRGAGGTGGLMGPANSARAHEKQWLLLDDTRTGVARDPLSGSIQRLEGMRAEDVSNVQMRNFALALTQGLGLIWSDPRAEGWLHAEEQWELFALFDRRYREHMRPPLREGEPFEQGVVAPDESTEKPVEAAVEEESTEGEALAEQADGGEGEGAVVPQTFLIAGDPMDLGLVIVVDEESRFYTHARPEMDKVLLQQARDALLRVGVPTQICLLQDMLDGFAPEAPVYAFLNLVHLDTEHRERLHERLAVEGAAAIWHYAPGVFDERASSNNVSATVGMDVERFEKPHPAGSVFTLGGAWLPQNETFGRRETWDPLFYIVDEAADMLAVYQEGNKPSVAMRTLEAGWTSVYIAEPILTPAFLREVFRILEQPLLVTPNRRNYFDTIYAGDELIGVHSRKVGERSFDVGDFYDIQDLFDPDIGWFNRDGFVLPLKQGETRLLTMSPPSGG